jgi:hypothetical protein
VEDREQLTWERLSEDENRDRNNEDDCRHPADSLYIVKIDSCITGAPVGLGLNIFFC